jgi:hypothetical protein
MKLARSNFSAIAALACAVVLAGCAQKPDLVASNCPGAKDCKATSQPLSEIDTVDILLVVDNSPSMSGKIQELKKELPRLLNAIVTGESEDFKFPRAQSVHVAVATSDMGANGTEGISNCSGLGNDGLFVQPGKAGVSCETMYPSYFAFEGGPAATATVDSVSCVPLSVFDDGGCGFEQPLEAALKALEPASSPITFLAGHGHGSDENAGFLRKNSLLVVVVVSDEDDCSANNGQLFTPPSLLDPSDPLASEGLNTRCALHTDQLYNVDRYIYGLRALRPHNDNVIFATIGGVPADLVSGNGTPKFDLVLADPRMQNVTDDRGTPDNPSDDGLRPSCMTADGPSFPPRRLVEVAKGFGVDGVIGSLCDDDFGATTGRIIEAIGGRMVIASAGMDAAVPVGRDGGT